MRSINPLTLLLSSVLLVFIALYLVKNNNNTFQLSKQELSKYMEIATKFQVQHQSYSNKTKIMQKLQNIAKTSGMPNVNIISQNKVIKLETKLSNVKQVEKFINKLLNEKFNIKKLAISEDKIIVEIGIV